MAFDDISGGYGAGDVVKGVSGLVRRGEVLCVIGRNGVGKSTLLKLLFGVLRGQGTVYFDGQRIPSWDARRRRKLGITYCPQERIVFDDLEVHDNLVLMRRDRRLDLFESYFSLFPILKKRLAQRAGTLSGGEKKLLSFTRGLAEESPLTLLDEPSEGVQWENIMKMADVFEARKALGHAFIVVEQNLQFAERIADRYLVLDQGRVILQALRQDVCRANLIEHLHV